MLDTVHTSETSLCLNETTLRCIPGGCNMYTRLRVNLKSKLESIW
jgi:hypothetical protein